MSQTELVRELRELIDALDRRLPRVEQAGEAWVRMQDRTETLIDPLGRIAIDRLGVVAGERILDVGCGCGQTLLQLADLTGPSGHVLGVDISPPMLGRARERVAPGIGWSRRSKNSRSCSVASQLRSAHCSGS